jgi:hypothetical protein
MMAALDVFVAGEPRLQLGRDGVDVVGGRQRRDRDALLTGTLQQAQHQVARPRRPRALQQVVEGLQPLGGLLRVDVGQVGRHTFADHPNPIGLACAGWVLRQIVAYELGSQLSTPCLTGRLLLADLAVAD